MDDTGEWFSYHPLFELSAPALPVEVAAELPEEIHRAAAEAGVEQGFPASYTSCAGGG